MQYSIVFNFFYWFLSVSPSSLTITVRYRCVAGAKRCNASPVQKQCQSLTFFYFCVTRPNADWMIFKLQQSPIIGIIRDWLTWIRSIRYEMRIRSIRYERKLFTRTFVNYSHELFTRTSNVIWRLRRFTDDGTDSLPNREKIVHTNICELFTRVIHR